MAKGTREALRVEVTFYMDGGMFETSYVKPTGGSIDNNRFYNTLHVLDGSSRISTIRVGTDADDPTSPTKYYLEDHLMDSLVVLETDGTLINREEFYPFGETSFGGFAKKRYRFNGKEKDEESGLYNYGQRLYAPWLCRFISVDPIAEKFPQLSSYNYASNRPVTSMDLEGLQAQDEGGSQGTQGGSDQGISTPIITPKLKSEFDSFMSSRSAQEVPSQNESRLTNLSISEGDNARFDTSQIEALAESQNNEMNQDQKFRDTFGGIEPLKFDFTKLNKATLKPQNFEKFLSPFDRQMHGSMRAGAKAYLLVTSVSGLTSLATGSARAMLSGSIKGGLSKINSQVAVNTIGNAALSGGTEFTGQFVYNRGDFRRVDYFDVGVSATLKSTPFSEMLKASTDINLDFQSSQSIFTGTKPFGDFAIESSVGIGLSVNPLTRTSLGNTFGISPSSLNSPISRFGSYSFSSLESVMSQSIEKGLRNEFK